MSKPFYITTPIYYVNDKPHIGHAYTSLACDVLARFMRLDGRPVMFLTGTDEHGQKVEAAARKNNQDPQEWVDQGSHSFRTLSNFLQLSHDDFIRTTEPRHKKAAQALWQTLVSRGEIYLGSYSGWYSIRDEAFYDESEITNGCAPTGAPVEWVEEPSYFFRLSAWQDKLLKFYEDNPDFIAPNSRRNEVIRFVERGLNDLSISRSTFKWGIPVPGNDAHVMYVWMDALTNYIAALGYPDTTSTHYQTFWPHSLHVVGKDILRFHAIYWPAFLMAADLLPPKRVFAHGWWTIEGQKMSKSVGNVIDPIELVNTYGLDQTRYFLLREVPFGQDGDFSHTAMTQRINSDLANDFGNLVQRVLSFIYKNVDAQIPTPGHLTDQDQVFLKSAQDLYGTMVQLLEQQSLHKALEAVWGVIAQANRYIESEQPWGLRKTDPNRMATVLYVLAEVIRHLAILAQPITPNAAEKMLDQLGISSDQRTFASLMNSPLVPGTKISEPSGVFPRLLVS